jgi:hypothetical protein
MYEHLYAGRLADRDPALKEFIKGRRLGALAAIKLLSSLILLLSVLGQQAEAPAPSVAAVPEVSL